jgi:hypothetical protein
MSRAPDSPPPPRTPAPRYSVTLSEVWLKISRIFRAKIASAKMSSGIFWKSSSATRCPEPILQTLVTMLKNTKARKRPPTSTNFQDFYGGNSQSFPDQKVYVAFNFQFIQLRFVEVKLIPIANYSFPRHRQHLT